MVKELLTTLLLSTTTLGDQTSTTLNQQAKWFYMTFLTASIRRSSTSDLHKSPSLTIQPSSAGISENDWERYCDTLKHM
jgi:hypothetical protein